MIKNDRQYEVTREQAHEFESAMNKLKSGWTERGGKRTLAEKTHYNAMQSMYEELHDQMREYEEHSK